MLYIHQKYPSITKFTFEDYSNIDCEEIDLTKKPPRKNRQPLNLAFFSILYHSKTWYEKHFDAKMEDDKKYKLYRENLKFLVDPDQRPSFTLFSRAAQLPKDQESILEPLYKSSKIYREFFNKIPKKERCNLMYSSHAIILKCMIIIA